MLFEASFYVSLALKKPKDALVSSSYLSEYIHSRDFQRELWSRTIHVAFPKKINLGEIGCCKVRFPGLKEQTAIADALQNCSKNIQSERQNLDQLKLQKIALMQQLLTGKRRVKTKGEAQAA